MVCIFCVLHRLSKILGLDLGPLLIAEVLFSNVGGTATGNVVCVCVCVVLEVLCCLSTCSHSRMSHVRVRVGFLIMSVRCE